MQQKTGLTINLSWDLNLRWAHTMSYMHNLHVWLVLQSHKNFVYCRLWFWSDLGRAAVWAAATFSPSFFVKEGILIENQQFIFKVRMFESTIDRVYVSLCNLQACGLILGWIFISWKVNLLLWAICKWIKRKSQLKTDISKGGGRLIVNVLRVHLIHD